jgi:hypothetical protein
VTVLSVAETALVQNPVAKNRGATPTPAGKLDDAFCDDLARGVRAAGQVDRLAHVVESHRHCLDVVLVERAVSQKWNDDHDQIRSKGGFQAMVRFLRPFEELATLDSVRIRTNPG